MKNIDNRRKMMRNIFINLKKITDEMIINYLYVQKTEK